MSVSIDSTLLEFRDKISPALHTASGMLTTLTSSLDQLNDSARTAVTELNSCYQGSGLTTAIKSFNSINAAVEGIKASFAEGPETVIGMSSDLIADIDDLDEKKKAIDALEDELSKLGGKRSYNAEKTNKAEVDAHNAKVAEKEAEKAKLEAEFNELQEDCKSQLAAIKAVDATIDISVKEQEFVYTGSLMEDLKNLTPGSYTPYKFTGKNGRTIQTYIYVPKNLNTTTGLPVTLYMGGTGERGNANAGGLPLMLQNGRQVDGIVVALEADSYSSYRQGDYIDTAIELTNNIVTTYKADPNRISVSGHSLGGIGSLCFAERYPEYFSVVAPVSGYNYDRGKNSSSLEEAYEKLRKANIVAVSGSGDAKSANSMAGLYNKIKDSGNIVFFTVKGGHAIRDDVYSKPIEVNGKTYSDWVDFCFSQTKEQVTIAS